MLLTASTFEHKPPGLRASFNLLPTIHSGSASDQSTIIEE